MDKLRALMEQLGGSKELVDKILEAFEAHQTKIEESVKTEYNQRLERAKQVCLEELQDHKKDVARKVQIFLESKVEKIEQQIMKQVAVKDSAAESKLQAIAALLEGVEVNGEGDKADIQAAAKQIKELQENLRTTQEQLKVITERAKRATSVAEKTLERNKVLSKELFESKKTVAESKATPKKAVTEDKAKKKAGKTVAEDRIVPKASTTRKSREEQIAKPKARVAPDEPIRTLGGYSPEAIAASID